MREDEKSGAGTVTAPCLYCGTLSSVTPETPPESEALTRPLCRRPLKGVPRPKPREKKEKAKCDFGRLVGDPVWAEYWRERRTGYVEAAGMAMANLSLSL